jgi:hypothetical protein
MSGIEDSPNVGGNAPKSKMILNAAKGLANAIRAGGGALGNLGEEILNQLEKLIAKEGKVLTGTNADAKVE